MTLQEQMQAKLESVGLPFTEIKCYGHQITVECISRETAGKWSNLLSRFAKVRGTISSRVYNQENQNTVMRPTWHRVYRVYAAIN